MKLNSMFKKPVDRPIEGVIKADDETSLLLEIEEYVLTNEVSKRLESFLEAYNNYENANGVWISGFFGSGKSHLLKMLAHLLENKDINGTPCLELFSPKCLDNEILKGDIKNAASIPSKSILFNIDQKADIFSRPIPINPNDPTELSCFNTLGITIWNKLTLLGKPVSGSFPINSRQRRFSFSNCSKRSLRASTSTWLG